MVVCLASNARLQVAGYGTEGQFGLGYANGGPVKQYGGGFFYEQVGFLFNFKHLIGYRQVPFHTGSTHVDMQGSLTANTQALRYMLQYKYWFSNGVRAGGIFNMKCAHKVKILYNYSFKFYFLIGLDNNFLFNRPEYNDLKARSYFPMATFGAGAHIFQFGGKYKYNIVYLEARGYRELYKLFKTDDFHHISTGLEFVLGLKLVREGGPAF